MMKTFSILTHLVILTVFVSQALSMSVRSATVEADGATNSTELRHQKFVKSQKCRYFLYEEKTPSCQDNMCTVDRSLFQEQGNFDDVLEDDSVCRITAATGTTDLHLLCPNIHADKLLGVPCATSNPHDKDEWYVQVAGGGYEALNLIKDAGPEFMYAVAWNDFSYCSCDVGDSGLKPFNDAYFNKCSRSLHIHVLNETTAGRYRCQYYHPDGRPAGFQDFIVELAPNKCKMCDDSSSCKQIAMPRNQPMPLPTPANGKYNANGFTSDTSYSVKLGETFCVQATSDDVPFSPIWEYAIAATDYQPVRLMAPKLKNNRVNMQPYASVYGDNSNCLVMETMTYGLPGDYMVRYQDATMTDPPALVFRLAVDESPASPWNTVQTAAIASVAGIGFLLLLVPVVYSLLLCKRTCSRRRRPDDPRPPVEARPLIDGEVHGGSAQARALRGTGAIPSPGADIGSPCSSEPNSARSSRASSTAGNAISSFSSDIDVEDARLDQSGTHMTGERQGQPGRRQVTAPLPGGNNRTRPRTPKSHTDETDPLLAQGKRTTSHGPTIAVSLETAFNSPVEDVMLGTASTVEDTRGLKQGQPISHNSAAGTPPIKVIHPNRRGLQSQLDEGDTGSSRTGSVANNESPIPQRSHRQRALAKAGSRSSLERSGDGSVTPIPDIMDSSSRSGSDASQYKAARTRNKSLSPPRRKLQKGRQQTPDADDSTEETQLLGRPLSPERTSKSPTIPEETNTSEVGAALAAAAADSICRNIIDVGPRLPQTSSASSIPSMVEETGRSQKPSEWSPRPNNGKHYNRLRDEESDNDSNAVTNRDSTKKITKHPPGYGGNRRSRSTPPS
eukprot:scpid27310/ scgid17901/ 